MAQRKAGRARLQLGGAAPPARIILGIRKHLRERLLRNSPDVFIGVDAPDFNLGLEADLRAAGIKTVHFVCPSIWAWRAERVEKIRRSADHVLCIFPFEPELLARHGIAATYVGHPLAGVHSLGARPRSCPRPPGPGRGRAGAGDFAGQPFGRGAVHRARLLSGCSPYPASASSYQN